MNFKNKFGLVKIIKLLLLSSTILIMAGCSGDSGSTTTTTLLKRTVFAPKTNGKDVVFGAASFDAVLKDDMPISSLATVYLDSKKIMIKNGKGVRAFEITLKFSDNSFTNFTSATGDFITKSPAVSEGTLATINWTGSATPHIVSIILTDANGGNIAALVK